MTRGDGATQAARKEVGRVREKLEELEARVAQNRQDLDLQFTRLAEMQAVIDRMQLGARKSRTGR
jgi:predicted transposase YdaD